MRNAQAPPTGRRLLSRTAEHALRAALFLARAERRELITAAEVAAALGTPPNYTAKTLRQLARRGVLWSVRGPHGVFSLSVEPSELSVALVVDAVDEVEERSPRCLLGDRLCDAGHPCAAHRSWTEVHERTSALLERTTLADLLAGRPAPSFP